MNYTSYKFEFPIPPEHYTTRIPPQPCVLVSYRIWLGGIITVEQVMFSPDVPGNIVDWEGLNKLIEEAAKSNSEDKEKPGKVKYGHHYDPDEKEQLIIEQHKSFV